ncbi:MAG: histidinol dehydrogenase [Phycisphaerales bacterium]|nr:MAG: histidinol dehydrogenase [Phycisphaerales bacterium]
MAPKFEQILILSSQSDFEEKIARLRSEMLLAARSAGYGSEQGKVVVDILHDVAERGDEAVAEYTEKFDSVRLTPEQFGLSRAELKAAHEATDTAVLDSLRKAIRNVREYQRKIFIGNRSDFSEGTGIRYTPLRRVGVCVPGAAAPLPSTVIMTVVPAQVAGVKEIAVVSPPRHKGSIHPVILAVCHELGVDEVYRIGGVQAVAALASEEGNIPKVDMIVGPGNKWVQSAKKNVSGDYVGIDCIAGPSEALIVANEQANPAWVAADMLGQAEHGPDSSAIVVTDSEQTAKAVLEELKKQVGQLPRAEDAKASLLSYSRIIVVDDMDMAIQIADDFAAEHLEVQCGDESREIANGISNAGAIFVGPYTPVAVGDYWAGPSHTLPTGTRAKFSSALTSNDFVKSISVVEYDKERLAASADDIVRLAEVEGLDAHARSVKIRLDT